MTSIHRGLRAALAALGLAACVAPLAAQTGSGLSPAQEAALRKALGERIQQLQKIDEINRTPMPGLLELRIGGDLFYTDPEGNYLLHGQLYDTKAKRNLTEERLDKLLAVAFDDLPLKDAFTIVRGNGKRRMAIFEDPNCGFCKRFETDLQKIDNVTVYMFLYPILGQDSTDKSRDIWCAPDKARAWQDWMVRNRAPAKASCDTAALTRNVEFGRKYRINGTPTTIFADGRRVAGAVGREQIEKLLADAK